MNDASEIIFRIGMLFIPFLFALSFHEYSHGWVANKLGDPTARLMGRLTLNPFAHADPIGTILFPIIGFATGFTLFGWAKPVPVNAKNLKNPRTGMFWVALAGPGSNVLLAFVSALMYVTIALFLTHAPFAKAARDFLDALLVINLALAFFNLFPIHPLDGGKIFAIFLPEKANRWLEENQLIISIVLIVLVTSGALSPILGPMIDSTRGLLLNISLHILGPFT